MDLVTIHETNYELIEIFIDDETFKGECKISDLSLPIGTTITMINRGGSIVAPSGHTIIYPGDILFVLVDKNKIDECTKAILRMFLKNSCNSMILKQNGADLRYKKWLKIKKKVTFI